MNTKKSQHQILIVDDEPIVRVALKAILERSGFEIDEAGNAVEGLKKLEGADYALVISDQKMPGMSGLDFLAQVKTLRPTTIRILTTVAFNLASHIEEINRAEVHQFIIKPWESKTLLETVRRGVQRYDCDLRRTSNQENHIAANQKLASKAVDLESSSRNLESEVNTLRTNWHQSLQVMSLAIATHLPELGTLAHQVRILCRKMAKELNLSARDREMLDLSAQLFEVGLLQLPGDLIEQWRTNPEHLSDTDWRMIHQHPTVGAKMIPFEGPYSLVPEIVAAHRERLDGSGYPKRLRGEQIPPMAQLLSAAIAMCESSTSPEKTLQSLWETSGVYSTEALEAIEKVIRSRQPEFA